jgi:putative photosynthetic complex assembly protein
MSHHHHAQPVPRGPLLAIGALVLATLIGAGFARLTGVGTQRLPDAPAVQVRELLFDDRADGSVSIREAGSGRVVATVAPGTGGFLRGTMRGLVRERKRQGIGDDVAFRLVGHADGRLTLEDPATGRQIDIGSFGPANSSSFAQLMAAR